MAIERGPRQNRETETREHSERKKNWAPPSYLPVPDPKPGVQYRYVRVSSLGNVDARNLNAKFRQHWVPVLAKDHPEIMSLSDQNSRFPENIEIGGLLLCANSQEIVEQRRQYYERKSDEQLQAVDNDYMRLNNSAMPLLKTERITREE